MNGRSCDGWIFYHWNADRRGHDADRGCDGFRGCRKEKEMNERTMATLKPCPFCGGEAVFESAHELTDGTFQRAKVMCPKCRITITGESRKSQYGWANNIDYMNSRRTAIESWNRRAPAQLEMKF